MGQYELKGLEGQGPIPQWALCTSLPWASLGKAETKQYALDVQAEESTSSLPFPLLSSEPHIHGHCILMNPKFGPMV